MLLENPGIRVDQKKHFNEVVIINRHYLKALSETEWDTEENQQMFHQRIDFLTGVYTKETEAIALAKMKKDLFKKHS